MIIPDSAHGTNPASVTLAGYEVDDRRHERPRRGRPRRARGALLDDDVAGIMLTNPSTLGLFEEDIVEIAEAVHEVGGLLYYDGANLNAILGIVRPGDMGFDIVHLNVHKTFATPHGGGGPGAGPVAVTAALAPVPPRPEAGARRRGAYELAMPERSIGRVHSWHGNALVLLRAWMYLRLNGGDGLKRVSEIAVLNANWIKERLRGTYDIAVRPDRDARVRRLGQDAPPRDGPRAPSTSPSGSSSSASTRRPCYFPLIVEEALMIEPTETESPQTVAALAEAFIQIADEALEAGNADDAKAAPRTTPVGRVDEARAARKLVVTFDQRSED